MVADLKKFKNISVKDMDISGDGLPEGNRRTVGPAGAPIGIDRVVRLHLHQRIPVADELFPRGICFSIFTIIITVRLTDDDTILLQSFFDGVSQDRQPSRRQE